MKNIGIYDYIVKNIDCLFLVEWINVFWVVYIMKYYLLMR